MAQPDPYSRLTNFTGTEAGKATASLGVALDSEFNAVANTVVDVLRNLAVLQRDDLQLANNAVGVDQLSDVALALMTGGLTVAGTWSSPTAYTAGNIYVADNAVYLVIEDHISSDIVTDIALGYVTGPIFDPAVALAATNNLSTGITATTAIAAGDFVHVYDSSGSAKVRKVDPSDPELMANGFSLSVIAPGKTGTIYFRGLNTAVTPTNYGRVWVHETIPGSYQNSAPDPETTAATFIQVLGTAVPGGIHFDPQTEILL